MGTPVVERPFSCSCRYEREAVAIDGRLRQAGGRRNIQARNKSANRYTGCIGNRQAAISIYFHPPDQPTDPRQESGRRVICNSSVQELRINHTLQPGTGDRDVQPRGRIMHCGCRSLGQREASVRHNEFLGLIRITHTRGKRQPVREVEGQLTEGGCAFVVDLCARQKSCGREFHIVQVESLFGEIVETGQPVQAVIDRDARQLKLLGELLSFKNVHQVADHDFDGVNIECGECLHLTIAGN